MTKIKMIMSSDCVAQLDFVNRENSANTHTIRLILIAGNQSKIIEKVIDCSEFNRKIKIIFFFKT